MKRYRRPFSHALIRSLWFIIEPLNKIAVILCAIPGKYPWWMVTPDDPISPFGSSTSPTASNEPTVQKVYKYLGRFIGDIYWLAWRNSLFGLTYWMKPAFLKDSNIKYEDLIIFRKYNRIFLQAPDGSWLTETTLKLGPFHLITGYRLGPIYNGHLENTELIRTGQPRQLRPPFHPNMDGRPIFSLRTKSTL